VVRAISTGKGRGRSSGFPVRSRWAIQQPGEDSFLLNNRKTAQWRSGGTLTDQLGKVLVHHLRQSFGLAVGFMP